MSENPPNQPDPEEVEKLENSKRISKPKTPEEMENDRRDAYLKYFPGSMLPNIPKKPQVQETPEEAEARRKLDADFGPSEKKEPKGSTAA